MMIFYDKDKCEVWICQLFSYRCPVIIDTGQPFSRRCPNVYWPTMQLEMGQCQWHCPDHLHLQQVRQYHGCWCPGFLCCQAISSADGLATQGARASVSIPHIDYHCITTGNSAASGLMRDVHNKTTFNTYTHIVWVTTVTGWHLSCPQKPIT